MSPALNLYPLQVTLQLLFLARIRINIPHCTLGNPSINFSSVVLDRSQ
jgi:hypothetical protein